jgi:HD domain
MAREAYDLEAWHQSAATETETTMADHIAGIEIPDTKLVTEATELVRDAATPLILHHSRRVGLFGSLQGQRLGLRLDPELLYVGALFHDLGLTSKYGRTDQRFEIGGADEARGFLASHQIPDDAIRRVWAGIALHTKPDQTPPSATSKPTSSNTSCPASFAAISWTSFSTRLGPSNTACRFEHHQSGRQHDRLCQFRVVQAL